MTAGATSRRRGSAASTAISAGRPSTPRSISVATAADNYFGVVGPTPVELLNRDWRSIYTWPQTTKNQARIAGAQRPLFGDRHIGRCRAMLYVRNFKQYHVDGNDADVERCSGSRHAVNTLCLDEDALPG